MYLHAELLVQQHDEFCAAITSTSGSRCRPVSQCVVGVVSVRRFLVQVEGPALQCEVGGVSVR